jgi:hypothetical protein
MLKGDPQTRDIPQRDLLVGKWSHLLAVDDDGTDQLPLLEHRHVEITSRAGAVDKGDYAGITLDVSLVHREVGNVEDLFVSEQAGERAVRMVAYVNHRFTPPPVHIGRCRPAMHRDSAKGVSLAQKQKSEVGLAKPCGVRQDGLEHGLQVAGRS